MVFSRNSVAINSILHVIECTISHTRYSTTRNDMAYNMQKTVCKNEIVFEENVKKKNTFGRVA